MPSAKTPKDRAAQDQGWRRQLEEEGLSGGIETSDGVIPIENIAQHEIIFSSSDPKVSRMLALLREHQRIEQIAPRIYTASKEYTHEELVRRNLYLILGKLYPGAMLSHRSALELRPTSAWNIFLTYTYTKRIQLPGVVIRFLEGPGPIEGDFLLSGQLYVAQAERALLENLQSSRQIGPESKTLTLPEIEDRLEEVIRVRGENGLNTVRDQARKIASVLGMETEFSKLNRLVSALLSSKPAKILSSPAAQARAFGVPYDPARILLFEKLFVELKQHVYADRPDQNQSNRAFRNFAFFDSYFSNFIEGTEFELEDAERIIQTGRPMPARDEDSHDILGTYKLLSNREHMRILPDSPEALLDLLVNRHKVLLSARVNKQPGQFKDRNNRAGETHFVDYKLVRGTLIKAFDYYRALQDPFARAAYMMFIISEIHPFIDGNGRVARVMMNAELVAQSQTRIMIPNVYRDHYLMALRKLTRAQDPGPYIRMLQKAQAFSEAIVSEEMEEMKQILIATNAFKDHQEANLLMPPDARWP